MDMKEVIRTRKSIRTFDRRPLTAEDRKKLVEYAETITNPYNIPVSFVFLDAKEHGLSSSVINGEQLYVAGKVKKVPYCEEAFGYSFEKLVLFAWSMGIGTTWIGGTMKRELFEKAADTKDDEFMPIVSPLGYPATEKAEVDIKLREMVHGDDRFDPSELFYEKDFSHPLIHDIHDDALEAVRWYPSAANMQPCRIVKDGNAYHFYEKHSERYINRAGWDVQAIDMGIALCHFMSICDGKIVLNDPGITTDNHTEYKATVIV